MRTRPGQTGPGLAKTFAYDKRGLKRCQSAASAAAAAQARGQGRHWRRVAVLKLPRRKFMEL